MKSDAVRYDSTRKHTPHCETVQARYPGEPCVCEVPQAEEEVKPPAPVKSPPSQKSLVRGHTYGCRCELCRNLPIWEHPDAFE